PDTGLYVQNAEYIEGLEPDLPPNLPPDLVIEVDIASPSTKRMAIYQALGVPEVWRYTKRLGVVIYHLEANVYIESSNSKAIPQLSADKLNEFIAQRQTQTDNQTIRAVRHWIQSLE
ncbi:MAG: Uma2 family endonuclease, partial [Cyanobacteria bacterium J06560_2]